MNRKIIIGWRSVLLGVALAGCSETGLSVELPDPAASNPPPLRATSQTDNVVQVTTPRVDILWMIDNSCSMSNEQDDLTHNIPYFMNFFVGSGLDYHVGVTSSDTISSNYSGSDGTLVVVAGAKYIDPETPNPVEVYVEMASLGIGGKFPERGLGATFLCLEEKRDTVNAGFYRDEAALHTIIISDEPDYTEASVITQPEYAEWYSSLKDDPEDRTFSAIIDPQRGSAYKNTAIEVGGIVWDLSDGDWPGVLEQLGLQAAGLSQEYFLSHLPTPGTIEVTVITPGGAELGFEEGFVDPNTGELTDQDGDGTPDGDWTYEQARNSITFVEFVPEAMSTVRLTYETLASVQF
ncbi:MAG: hypothetical protein ABMA64_26975 [Myxococcota bacterium]